MNQKIPAIKGFTKVETYAFVRMRLTTVDAWAKAACLKIFDRQTAVEKRTHSSKIRNGIGFSKHDAPILTSFALRLKANQKLSAPDVNRLRKLMGMYAAQLTQMWYESDKGKTLQKYLVAYYNRENVPIILEHPVQLELPLEKGLAQKAG